MKNYLHQDVGFQLFKDIVNRQDVPLKELFEIHHTSTKRTYEFFKLHFGTTPGVLRKEWHVPHVKISGQKDMRWVYNYEGTPDSVNPDYSDIERGVLHPHDRTIEVIVDDVRVTFPDDDRRPMIRLGPNADEHILISNPIRYINLNHQARLCVDVKYDKHVDKIRMYLVDNYDRPMALNYTLSVEYSTRCLSTSIK